MYCGSEKLKMNCSTNSKTGCGLIVKIDRQSDRQRRYKENGAILLVRIGGSIDKGGK